MQSSIGNRGGRRKTPELEILRCMIWAHALVAANGGEPTKLVFLYPPTKAGKDSTLFFKTLEHGRPSPKLLLEDGSAGPALRAESEFPGSLQWLVHPLWNALEMVDFPFLRVVYHTMADLTRGWSPALIDFHEGEARRSDLPLHRQLDILKELGSLDALACVLLFAQEAYCLCKPGDHAQVSGFAKNELSHWLCLSWMPPALKNALIHCIQMKIHRCTPVPLDADSARVESLQRSLLSDGLLSERSVASHFPKAAVTIVSASRASCFPDSPSFDLTKQAVKTIQLRIDPWIDSGTP